MTDSTPAPTSPTGHLVLLRHGETEWSRTRRHTGLTDVPLTEAGEAAARRCADLLRGRPVVRVVVSPFARARRTAELAGLTGLGIRSSSTSGSTSGTTAATRG